MKKNYPFVRVLTAAPVMLFSLSSYASDTQIPSWVQSYAVEGTCYCQQPVSSAAARTIVATPVGGQSVEQICSRVGTGPTLSLVDGQFAYPVYTDAQCGNGPVLAPEELSAGDCEGRLFVDDSVCMGSGPTWDLVSAYSQDNSPSVETTIDQTNIVESLDTATPKNQEPESVISEIADAETLVESEAQTSTLESALITNDNQSEIHSPDLSIPDDVQIVTAESLNTLQKENAEDDFTTANTSSISENQIDSTSELQSITSTELQSTESVEQLGLVESSPLNSEQLLQPNVHSDNTLQNPTVVAESGTQSDTATKGLSDTSNSVESDSGIIYPTDVEVQQAEDTEKDAIEAVAENVAANTTETPVTPAALKLPARVRQKQGRLDYLQVAPVSYDFGGAGASFQGSVEFFPQWRVMATALATQDYDEYSVELGFVRGLAALRQLNLGMSLGVEYGRFDLGLTDFDDTGAFVTGWLNYSLRHNFNVSAGFSYSSFFDGDPSVFALGLYRLSRNLDLSGKAEVGDNDNVGIGIRFHFR